MNLALSDYTRVLSAYLRPQAGRVALLLVLLLAGIGVQLISPQFIRLFIDTAQNGGALETLVGAALLFIGAAVVGQVFAVAVTYLSEQVAWTATNGLRADLAAHCLGLDLGFHKQRTPGELIERIDGDVTAMATFFSQFVVNVVGNLVLLVGVLVLLMGEDWRAGAALTVFAAGALLVLMRLRQVAVPAWTAYREMSARFFGFLGEHLAGTEDTRANGASGYVRRRFFGFLRDWLPVELRAARAGGLTWAATTAVFAVGLALALGVSYLLWSAGAITVGGVYLIFTYTDLLRRPIEQLRSQVQELQQASAGIIRVSELMNRQPALRDGPGAAFPAGPLAVALERVSFNYDDDEPVLHDLSLYLPPGAVLGLLGRTGSGKSTLARLLLRFYDPVAGEIRVGDVPLPTARLVDLRRRIGLVTQDVQLFQGTLRDNLTFFDRSISDERIHTALDDLGLSGWLNGLPGGLETELEAGGGGLSAGEAQLLAFGRIFLADPGLVILDEASSRLDPATEALIERAVDRLLTGRTGVIIAHRLATVQRADQIVILEQGRVLEQGERVRLAADATSRFATLLRTGLQEVLA